MQEAQLALAVADEAFLKGTVDGLFSCESRIPTKLARLP